MQKRSYEEECQMAEEIGRVYKASKMQAHLKELYGSVYANSRKYDGAKEYIDYVDEALRMCGTDTRHIITHEYLFPSDSKWYLGYFSKSTFYRLKRVAITEFLRCLDL